MGAVDPRRIRGEAINLLRKTLSADCRALNECSEHIEVSILHGAPPPKSAGPRHGYKVGQIIEGDFRCGPFVPLIKLGLLLIRAEF